MGSILVPDTIAAIADGVAAARWGVLDNLRAEALARLDSYQKILCAAKSKSYNSQNLRKPVTIEL